MIELAPIAGAQMQEFILMLGQIGAVAVLGAIGALTFRKSFRLSWFLVALGLYALYDLLLTRFFFTLPNFPPAADWNWLGKVMAIAAMLAIAALPAFGFRRCGLTLKQERGWPMALAVLALFCALFFYWAWSDGEGPANAETIAFQWTMPGLDEEIFYRGVLLLAMNEAFRARLPVLGAPIGYGGVLTSVLFGLAHGLSYEDGAFAFDAMIFAMTGVPSLVLLWLREKTGSVVMPIIAHNVANGAFTVL